MAVTGDGLPAGYLTPLDQVDDDVLFLGEAFHTAPPAFSREALIRLSIQSLISDSTQADARAPSFTGAGKVPS